MYTTCKFVLRKKNLKIKKVIYCYTENVSIVTSRKFSSSDPMRKKIMQLPWRLQQSPVCFDATEWSTKLYFQWILGRKRRDFYEVLIFSCFPVYFTDFTDWSLRQIDGIQRYSTVEFYLFLTGSGRKFFTNH